MGLTLSVAFKKWGGGKNDNNAKKMLWLAKTHLRSNAEPCQGFQLQCINE